MFDDICNFQLEEQGKFCTVCGEYKVFSSFTKRKRAKDGFSSSCSKCSTISHRNWRYKNPDKFKNSQLKTMYGITLEQYHQMIKSQEGKCDICKRSLDMGKKTHVDHCHIVDKVRGLLCNSCNGGLSVYEKHAEAVEAYLEKYSFAQTSYKNYIPSHAFLY